MRKTVKILIVVITLIILIIIYSLYRSKYSLLTTEYAISSEKLDSNIRIIHLTDLHNSIFGENNSRLIQEVEKQRPDIILITGDLVNGNEKRTDIAVNLVAELSKISPIFISLGNHEYAYDKNFKGSIRSLFEDAGAVVLDKEYKEIYINNQHIRIGGLFGYCLPEKYLKTGEADPDECAFLSEFEDTDIYKILLCHMPVCWIKNHGLDEWNVDCVLSGHVHGGEIIIPFAGGLYGPDFGRFPGKLEGVFNSKDGKKHLVLSRGLGTNETIPRLNNYPEVICLSVNASN